MLAPYTGTTELQESNARDPLVVYAGRHIPEKRVPALVKAMANLRASEPGFGCLILGDGPERTRVLELIDELDLVGVVEAPGFVGSEEVHEAFARATCLVLPSSREGYGLIVVEAAAFGSRASLSMGPTTAPSSSSKRERTGTSPRRPRRPTSLRRSCACIKVAMRFASRRRRWFRDRVRELSVENAVRRVTAAYAGDIQAERMPANTSS